MHEIVTIPVVDLLLDQENARIGQAQDSQPATYVALARETTPKALLNLCEHIVDHGLDPLSLTGVVATGDKRRRYRVLEGNRRVLALKVLETPTLLTGKGVLSKSEEKRLSQLSHRFQRDPITAIACVLFDDEDAPIDWVDLRHTGAHDGAGLMNWNSTEQDRFRLRHGRIERPTPALQIIDFVKATTGDGEGSGGRQPRIATTLTRMMSTPEIREAYGLDMVGGELVALYPAEVVGPGLQQLVSDLTSRKLRVGQVYDAPQRRTFAANRKRQAPLDEAKKLPAPVQLGDLAAGKSTPAAKAKRPKARKPAPQVTTIVPPGTKLSPSQPRLNAIYDELSRLDASTYTNAGAVLLRVFLELVVDHEIQRIQLMPEAEMLKSPLAKRLKVLAQDLADRGRISEQLRRAVQQIAESQNVIAASTHGFNQYVHNEYVHPALADLQAAWRQLEPFLEEIIK